MTSCCDEKTKTQDKPYLQAIKFATTESLDDISKWMFIGIVIAGVIAILVAGFILVKKELGTIVTTIYLDGIAVISVLMGLLLDGLIGVYGLSVNAEAGHAHHFLPMFLTLGSAMLLLLLAAPGVRCMLFPFLK